MVNIKKEVAFLGGQTGIDQILMIGGGHQRVQSIVFLGDHGVGFGVPEHSFL